MNTVKEVGVLGAGMMGAEIALCFAMSGCNVVIKDKNKELAQSARAPDRISLLRVLGVGDIIQPSKRS